MTSFDISSIPFSDRHNSITPDHEKEMLTAVGVGSLDELIDQTIPAQIRLKKPLNLPEPLQEHAYLEEFRAKLAENRRFKSYIGLGYYPTQLPTVIQRNILENPGWYTAYTPYQAEIAQGRLEALLNFQTLVMDLTGMELANASLLDEATAAAEAMSMMHAVRSRNKKAADTLLVDQTLFPQTRDVLLTRAEPLGITLKFIDTRSEMPQLPEEVFGLLVQYPDGNGNISDHRALFQAANDKEILVGVITDLLSLTLLEAPGNLGADVVIGSAQRFGIPLGYGGPHAAFFATREKYKRQIPGRIIGVSVDSQGNPAYRMALQTREQHIRREKATSNICTAQVLLAVISGMYAAYHGPEGLKKIASRIHLYTVLLAEILESSSFTLESSSFFDTLKIYTDSDSLAGIRERALNHRVNLRYFTGEKAIGISLNEATTLEDVAELVQIFTGSANEDLTKRLDQIGTRIPEALQRKDAYLTHPIFNSLHHEHELLRYMKKLENKDISLVHSMISLGSCTMKLNATTEMIPLTWPELADIHPFAPSDQAVGYAEMIEELSKWLKEVTGFHAISFQPNSGAQGEYTGLMVIRAYHHARGDQDRQVVLIPSSAHGTNPASGVMAGMKVVIVACDRHGNIDIEDLKAKVDQHRDQLSALMVTYPSTHGVFEENITDICQIIHEAGGQVYMDGANMNAQVGLTSPAAIGADVCHLNLHKTFCIPHGGGGPGMGPIGVAEHLAEFLPGHVFADKNESASIHAVSAAPFGSASILSISYAYIRMMGAQGLTRATQLAILNANYIKERLAPHYSILYTNKNGRSAHEFIVDCREFKNYGIEVEDVAKRLMDYGFHAPTMSFPVPGTMMIEPTESESLQELDRFCEAFIEIRKEIDEVANGTADPQNNVLKNAPHTAHMATRDQWDFPYSREKAVYPLAFVRENKFWPPVARIDSAYGDRNLMCSCIPVDSYESMEEKELVNELR